MKSKNQQILKSRTLQFNKTKGPRVGDYLKYPDGSFTRFTVDLGESLQTGGERGSYFLYGSCCDYSGGCDSGIKKSDLVPTRETKPGDLWFFDEGITGAGRRKDFQINFRVFDIKEGTDLSGLWGYIDKLKKQDAQ